jgi:valyl-tRNA synthetase
MNQCRYAKGFDPAANTLTVNRWIVSELAKAARSVTAALEEFRFNDSANACYQFVWSTYCDWYLEFIKPILNGSDEEAKAETSATALWVLHRALHLLHPTMPFVTEELWEKTGGEGLLITARWPEFADALLDPAAEAELGWVVRLVSEIRAVRSEMNVPGAAKIPLLIKGASSVTSARLLGHVDVVATLARLSGVEGVAEAPKGSVQIVLDEATLILPLADVIDLAQERARLDKELKRLDAAIKQIDAKLGNESFVAKAPPDVVEEQRQRREEAAAAKSKISDALARLAAA